MAQRRQVLNDGPPRQSKAAQLQALRIAPADASESAIVTTLPPGSFYLGLGKRYLCPSQLSYHLNAPSEVHGKNLLGDDCLAFNYCSDPPSMKGKDAIVVDDEADIDAAVEGTAQAAFGYQGQKCSACSRAIVSEKIYDTFVQKLVERTKKITLGPSDDPNNYMGPVISQSAMKTILDYIEVGKKEGKLLTGGKRAAGDGYFIEPTIIADVDPKARLAQEEVFGPVLAVIKAKNYDHALEIANNTEFGLTGAVYSKNPEKIKKAEEAFHVGNLYLNRKCTGAMVGAHPFGGFNMSGTDSKTGGKDYLLLFLQAKSVAEKVSN
jgi:1-pyrroline-5-carboxylate dehydrogenase